MNTQEQFQEKTLDQKFYEVMYHSETMRHEEDESYGSKDHTYVTFETISTVQAARFLRSMFELGVPSKCISRMTIRGVMVIYVFLTPQAINNEDE